MSHKLKVKGFQPPVRVFSWTTGEMGWPWFYVVVCSCGAQTHPMAQLSWKRAMLAGRLHLQQVVATRWGEKTIEQAVQLFREQLNREL